MSGETFVSTKTITADMWNHLSVVTDKESKTVKFYCNNELIDTFQMSDTIASKTEVSSNVLIGTDGSSFLNGVLDDIHLYNKPVSKETIQSLNTFTFANNLILKHDFENIIDGSNVRDESGTNHGVLYNPTTSDSSLDFTSEVGSYAMGGTAFVSGLDKYIEIADSKVQGSVLNNCTMMAWVKNQYLDTFEPILYKEGVYSFGLRNGSPILELGDGTSFHPLPAVTNMNMSYDSYTASLTDSLIGSYNFENANDVNQGESSYSNIQMETVNETQVEGHVSGTIGLKLDASSYIKIKGNKLGGINMDAFTFGAWIKPTTIEAGLTQPILFRENDSTMNLEFNLVGSELQVKL